MQNLAHTAPLLSLFVHVDSPTPTSASPLEAKGPLTVALADFLRSMWKPGPTFSPGCNMFCFFNLTTGYQEIYFLILPKSILKHCILFILCRAPRFKSFQQQDSHEVALHFNSRLISQLLHYLLDGLSREETVRLKAEKEQQGTHVTSKTPVKTFVEDIFGGVLGSVVTCHHCEMVYCCFEIIIYL